MEAGKIVIFKTHDGQEHWETGLLLRYDKLLCVGEISKGEFIFYAPRRLMRQTNQEGSK